VDLACKQPGCKISQGGKCLEGRELDKCPYVIRAQVDGPALATPPSVVESLDAVDLPSGRDLTLAEANRITSVNLSRLIVLAGAVGSGKTTLLGSIYDQFQEGPFAGYAFGGSQTLVGLELRCHSSRTSSGRDDPDTERTKPGQDNNLLHLRVRRLEGDLRARDLLFSDIAGETFKALLDASTATLPISLMASADHVALLLDGEKIANRALRAQVRSTGETFLRSATDAKLRRPIRPPRWSTSPRRRSISNVSTRIGSVGCASSTSPHVARPRRAILRLYSSPGSRRRDSRSPGDRRHQCRCVASLIGSVHSSEGARPCGKASSS
jgi:hypothetical protein